MVMNERKQIIKRIGIVFGVIIAIFLIINLVWFLGVKTRYMQLEKKLDKVVQTEEEKEEGIKKDSYEKTENGYKYQVKGTGYLGNSGFALVSDEEGLVLETDEKGNVISDNGTHVALYIWPKMFSGYTYGIDISNADDWYQIEVDKDGQCLVDEDRDPEQQEKRKKVLEENREEINKLFELADKMWNIR